MGYHPNPQQPLRDETFPSQIAAERPMMAPRIHSASMPDPHDSLRGGKQPDHDDSMCDRFNRELREGLGTSRPDNTDE